MEIMSIIRLMYIMLLSYIMKLMLLTSIISIMIVISVILLTSIILLFRMVEYSCINFRKLVCCMRFVVISDLHLISSCDDTSISQEELIDRQRVCLKKISDTIIDLHPEYLFILGDTFDKISSDMDALLEVFKTFLGSILSKGAEIFIITGNHDISTPEFWSQFKFDPKINITITGVDKISHYIRTDDVGYYKYHFYLMPFIRGINNLDLDYFYSDIDIPYNKVEKRYRILFGHQYLYFDKYFEKVAIDVPYLLHDWYISFWGHYHTFLEKLSTRNFIAYIPGRAICHDDNYNFTLGKGFYFEGYSNVISDFTSIDIIDFSVD